MIQSAGRRKRAGPGCGLSAKQVRVHVLSVCAWTRVTAIICTQINMLVQNRPAPGRGRCDRRRGNINATPAHLLLSCPHQGRHTMQRGGNFKAAHRLKAHLSFSNSCTSERSLLQGATPGAAVAESLLYTSSAAHRALQINGSRLRTRAPAQQAMRWRCRCCALAQSPQSCQPALPPYMCASPARPRRKHVSRNVCSTARRHIQKGRVRTR